MAAPPPKPSKPTPPPADDGGEPADDQQRRFKPPPGAVPMMGFQLPPVGEAPKLRRTGSTGAKKAPKPKRGPGGAVQRSATMGGRPKRKTKPKKPTPAGAKSKAGPKPPKPTKAGPKPTKPGKLGKPGKPGKPGPPPKPSSPLVLTAEDTDPDTTETDNMSSNDDEDGSAASQPLPPPPDDEATATDAPVTRVPPGAVALPAFVAAPGPASPKPKRKPAKPSKPTPPADDAPAPAGKPPKPGKPTGPATSTTPPPKPVSPVEASSAVEGGDGGGNAVEKRTPVAGRPPRGVKPAKPGKPGDGPGGKPAKPGKPGKPVKPGKPGKPGKPPSDKPAKPGKPGKPSKPSKPGKPSPPPSTAEASVAVADAPVDLPAPVEELPPPVIDGGVQLPPPVDDLPPPPIGDLPPPMDDLPPPIDDLPLPMDDLPAPVGDLAAPADDFLDDVPDEVVTPPIEETPLAPPVDDFLDDVPDDDFLDDVPDEVDPPVPVDDDFLDEVPDEVGPPAPVDDDFLDDVPDEVGPPAPVDDDFLDEVPDEVGPPAPVDDFLDEVPDEVGPPAPVDDDFLDDVPDEVDGGFLPPPVEDSEPVLPPPVEDDGGFLPPPVDDSPPPPVEDDGGFLPPPIDDDGPPPPVEDDGGFLPPPVDDDGPPPPVEDASFLPPPIDDDGPPPPVEDDGGFLPPPVEDDFLPAPVDEDDNGGEGSSRLADGGAALQARLEAIAAAGGPLAAKGKGKIFSNTMRVPAQRSLSVISFTPGGNAGPSLPARAMDDSDVPTVDVTFREGDKNGRQVLKTGSMFRIVERLTFEEHPDQDFQRVFLLTYHAYTDGATVMRYILNRFHIQPPEDCTDEEELKEFEKSRKRPIRLRIVNFCNKWLQERPADFADDEELCRLFFEVVNEVSSSELSSAADKLTRLFDKNVAIRSTQELVEIAVRMKRQIILEDRLWLPTGETHRNCFLGAEAVDWMMAKVTDLKTRAACVSLGQRMLQEGLVSSSIAMSVFIDDVAYYTFSDAVDQQIQHTQKPPKSYPPKNPNFRFCDLKPVELARQISISDQAFYVKIEPKECLSQNWNKGRAFNVTTMIQRFNQLSGFVATEIIREEDLKARRKVLKFFIAVAQNLFDLQNFNGCQAILSGLNNSAVFRLKKTWAKLKSSEMKTFESLTEVLQQKGNYKNLREHLHHLQPPCIPYLGMYLTDLTFIEDGNPDEINHLINFEKHRKVAEVIAEIQLYQQTAYNLTNIPEIRERLSDFVPMDDDELYAQSLVIEPRESR